MDRVRVGMTRWAAVAVLALGVPPALCAQDSAAYRNHLYDTFQATVNFTTVVNRSNARVDAANGDVGTTLDFRTFLGVSGTIVQPAIGLRWKPGRHTELDLGFQFINASGARTFDDTLAIGGDTLSGAIDADTKLSSDNLTFQFKYSIWAAERHNIGVALGLGAIFFSLKFDGSADVCTPPGGNCSGGSLAVDRSFTGPTGSLGAFGQWRLGNRWYVGGDARGMGAKVDRFDVSVFEADATVDYFLSNRWGLGLAWYYTDVTVDVGPKSGGTAVGDMVGKVAYNYSSIRLGVVAAF